MACGTCNGTGVRVYPNSNTYRARKKGERYLAVRTQDTCNVCWGSGDFARPYPSLTVERLHREEKS